MQIFHLSVECYPIAKVGGLADVVGALPKYQNRLGADAKVVMPFYENTYVHTHEFTKVFDDTLYLNETPYHFEVLKEISGHLGFDLYLVKVYGLLDRPSVYGYWDEALQFIAFQRAALQWLCHKQWRPDILHCHDYHTGLVPFFIEHCPEYSFLKGVKTIGTIHNGNYQGIMDWDMIQFLPAFDEWKWGMLDWNGKINQLAALIKSCHAFTAVSEGYLHELFESALTLEPLIRQESAKAFGIINGIDTDVWDPSTDEMLEYNYDIATAAEGKSKNKAVLCAKYNLNPDLPLFAFIGRFALEKGADLLPEIIARSIQENRGELNFMVLGSGSDTLASRFAELQKTFHVNLAIDLGYKEYLSHQIYASADFLLMPSRVEPCGLNQMYAMRYGTVPVVREVGGLKDTVKDIGAQGGYGIRFMHANTDDPVYAIYRALKLYRDKSQLTAVRHRMMQLDFSWSNSAKKYLQLYRT